MQVRPNLVQPPLFFVDHLLHFFALIEPDLHDELAAGLEEPRRVAQQAPNDGEPVTARRERDERFVIAHLALQPGQCGGGYVRRI